MDGFASILKNNRGSSFSGSFLVLFKDNAIITYLFHSNLISVELIRRILLMVSLFLFRVYICKPFSVLVLPVFLNESRKKLV